MRCVSPRRVRRRGGTSCLSSSPRALKMGRADVNACSGRDQSDAPVRRGLSHRRRGFLCSPWSHQDPARALRRRPRKRPAKALVQRANLLLEPSKAFWQGESLIAPSHWPRWVMWRSLGAGFGTQLHAPAGPKKGANVEFLCMLRLGRGEAAMLSKVFWWWPLTNTAGLGRSS
jgi:hypothetical protein